MPTDPYPTDTVFLLGERRAEGSGRVHEIGTRARVVARRDEILELEIGGETLFCPAALAAPRTARAHRRGGLRGGVAVAR
jgi:hypothetical protein